MGYERDNIRAMSGYVSGEQPETGDIIKLNTNENPYPPAPEIQEVIAGFHSDSLRRYPPPTADRFRDMAASLHSVKRANLIATRGGDELLRLLITTFVDPGEPIGMTDPTYSLYPVLAHIQNCPVIQIPMEEDWSLPEDFADQINASGCKLTFLVNPHAPSGRLLSADKLSTIAEDLHSVLLIDEAYVDFVSADYDSIPLIFKHDNLIILRTLSKGYSLAGLRFGYGIGSESVILPMLEKTRDSYNLDLFSQLIAEAALTHREFAMANCRNIIGGRVELREALQELGLHADPSEANFLLVTVAEDFFCSAESLYLKLKNKGILVRYFSEERLKNKVRITIGSSKENDRLIETIKALQTT